MNDSPKLFPRMLRGSFALPGIVLLLLFVCWGAGCGGGDEARTYYGKLGAIEFEHRNVIEYKGEGGPQVSLLVTAGRAQGVLADDGMKLHYRVDDEPFQVMPLRSTVSGRRFVAEIPHQESGTKVNYYIEVVHRQGKRLTFPSKADEGEYCTIRIE